MAITHQQRSAHAGPQGRFGRAAMHSGITRLSRIGAGGTRRASLLREMATVVFAYLAYFAVRGLTQGGTERAVGHAAAIVALEKRGGFFWEPAIQSQVVQHHWMITAANWMYIYGHWPLILGVAIWLLVTRPASYRLFRNAFFISGAIGIAVFMTYPVAPPRLADVGVVDTVTMYSHAYRVLQPPAFVNQYAAVPSLHFGWDLLIGLALIREAKWIALKAVGVIVPVLMLLAIVVTANHYIFDAITGGFVAMAGLALAYGLQRYGKRLRTMRASAAPVAARVVFGRSAFAR